MKASNQFRFISRDQRERGGVGFQTDDRTVYEGDRDPLELRQGDKIRGRGQILDFFEVDAECSHCHQIAPTNVIGLCGTCAQTVTLGDRRNHGGNGDPAFLMLERLHRRGLSAEATIRGAIATMGEEEGAAFLRRVAHRIRR